MPAYIAEIYFQEIDRIRSFQMIDALEASSFPYMSESARSDTANRFRTRAEWQDAEVISDPKTLLSILGG